MITAMLATDQDNMDVLKMTNTMLITEHDSMKHTKKQTESKTDGPKDDNHNASHGT